MTAFFCTRRRWVICTFGGNVVIGAMPGALAMPDEMANGACGHWVLSLAGGGFRDGGYERAGFTLSGRREIRGILLLTLSCRCCHMVGVQIADTTRDSRLAGPADSLPGIVWFTGGLDHYVNTAGGGRVFPGDRLPVRIPLLACGLPGCFVPGFSCE